MPNLTLDLQPHPGPGRLLCFAGIKGAGKSTLIRGVQAELARRGVTTVTMKQHSAAYYALPMVDAFIQDTDVVAAGEVDITALTLVSLGDTLQLIRSTVLPLLRAGTWVLLDRYVIDQVAGFAMFSSERADLQAVLGAANRLTQPDLALLMRVNSVTAISRIEQRDGAGLTYDAAHYTNADDAYRQFAEHNGWTVLSGEQDSGTLLTRVTALIDALPGAPALPVPAP